MVKSAGMRWKCMSHAWARENAYRIVVGKPEERDDLEYLSVYGRIILK
jgi:hypothetical protein